MTAIFSGVSISKASGAFGINNSGVLQISDATISDSRAGLQNFRQASLTTVAFSGNAGFAVVNDANLTVNNCTFTGNEGSGVENNSTATITGSSFSGNSGSGVVSGTGDMSLDPVTITVTNSTFANNNSNTSGGGLDVLASVATVTDDTFSDNTAQENGGGLYFSESSFTLTNVTVSGNASGNFGGGIYAETSGAPDRLGRSTTSPFQAIARLLPAAESWQVE